MSILDAVVALIVGRRISILDRGTTFMVDRVAILVVGRGTSFLVGWVVTLMVVWGTTFLVGWVATLVGRGGSRTAPTGCIDQFQNFISRVGHDNSLIQFHTLFQ
jgi:hypothetical protein